MSSRKAKPQSPTGPPVRRVVPAVRSLIDFQQHYLIGQRKTRRLPYPRTRLRRLPNGITNALMMMMMITTSRKFQAKTSRPSLQGRKRRKRKIRVQKKRPPPGRTGMMGQAQTPRWWNQRMWSMRPCRSRLHRNFGRGDQNP